MAPPEAPTRQPGERLQLALDQSVPTPILNSLDRYLPEVGLVPLRRIDNRLSGLDDRELVLALHQLGWTGLVTANARMLRIPDLLAALLRTGLTTLVIEGVDDDPLAAVGALLLGLPGASRLLAAPEQRSGDAPPDVLTGTGGDPRIIRLGARRPARADVRNLLRQAAARQHRDVADLYREVGVSDEELATPVLGARFGAL